MANKRVADVLVDTLVAAGVKRVYGLVGDSLNGVTDSIRRGKICNGCRSDTKKPLRSPPAQKRCDRTTNCLRGKLRARQSPFDQRPLRLSSQPSPCACDCGADSERRSSYFQETSDDSSYVTGTELFVDGGFAQV
jgi:hypothetical protein